MPIRAAISGLARTKRPNSKYITDSNSCFLLALPLELLDMILQPLPLKTVALVARCCKALHHILAPSLSRRTSEMKHLFNRILFAYSAQNLPSVRSFLEIRKASIRFGLKTSPAIKTFHKIAELYGNDQEKEYVLWVTLSELTAPGLRRDLSFRHDVIAAMFVLARLTEKSLRYRDMCEMFGKWKEGEPDSTSWRRCAPTVGLLEEVGDNEYWLCHWRKADDAAALAALALAGVEGIEKSVLKDIVGVLEGVGCTDVLARLALLEDYKSMIFWYQMDEREKSKKGYTPYWTRRGWRQALLCWTE